MGHLASTLRPCVARLSRSRLYAAACTGDAGTVRLLLSGRCRRGHYSHALREAAFRGHAEVVQLLLADGRADPAAHDSVALQHAGVLDDEREGSLARLEAVVHVLLADGRADPAAQASMVLYTAVRLGYVNLVRDLLLDGRANPREALVVAAWRGHVDTVRVLLADGRADPGF
jgi:hypothetical protein